MLNVIDEFTRECLASRVRFELFGRRFTLRLKVVRVVGIEPTRAGPSAAATSIPSWIISDGTFRNWRSPELNRGFHRAEIPWLAPLRTRAKGSAAAPRRHLPVETTRPMYTL